MRNSDIAAANTAIENRVPYVKNNPDITVQTFTSLDSSAYFDVQHATSGKRFQLIFDFTRDKMVVGYYNNGAWVTKDLNIF